MTERALLPRFVREALEEDEHAGALDGESAERSLLLLEARLLEGGLLEGGELEGQRPGADLLDRLEGAVREPPLRYAPFFARAAELFDLPEEVVVAELTRLRDPKVWSFTGLPGIANVEVKAGPAVAAAETLFVRFNPGVYFPRHRHLGLERVLVLEGSYEDSGGLVHRPGELREWASGTEHSFKVHEGGPCIFASVVFGRRFSSWPLRALASLLRR
jgi:hypothetical protein